MGRFRFWGRTRKELRGSEKASYGRQSKSWNHTGKGQEVSSALGNEETQKCGEITEAESVR